MELLQQAQRVGCAVDGFRWAAFPVDQAFPAAADQVVVDLGDGDLCCGRRPTNRGRVPQRRQHRKRRPGTLPNRMTWHNSGRNGPRSW